MGLQNVSDIKVCAQCCSRQTCVSTWKQPLGWFDPNAPTSRWAVLVPYFAAAVPVQAAEMRTRERDDGCQLLPGKLVERLAAGRGQVAADGPDEGERKEGAKGRRKRGPLNGVKGEASAGVQQRLCVRDGASRVRGEVSGCTHGNRGDSDTPHQQRAPCNATMALLHLQKILIE